MAGKKNNNAEEVEQNAVNQADARVFQEIKECFDELEWKAELDENVFVVETGQLPLYVEVGREDEAMPLFVMVSVQVPIRNGVAELDIMRVVNEMNNTFAVGKVRVAQFEDEDGSIYWHASLCVAEPEHTIEDFAIFFNSAADLIRIMLYTLSASHPEILAEASSEEVSDEEK